MCGLGARQESDSERELLMWGLGSRSSVRVLFDVPYSFASKHTCIGNAIFIASQVLLCFIWPIKFIGLWTPEATKLLKYHPAVVQEVIGGTRLALEQKCTQANLYARELARKLGLEFIRYEIHPRKSSYY